MTVHFKPGSARLSAKAKQEIDAMAESMREDLKGWIVAVEGFADSTGRTAANRSLSERRANAVIDYLVTFVAEQRKKARINVEISAVRQRRDAHRLSTVLENLEK